jgi:hypothetical protein
MIADYKLRKGQYARMKLGLSRGEVVTQINAIKRLFPFEDAYASYDEINQSELRFQIAQPNFGTNEILGLRPTPHAERPPEQKFKARLNIMLEAFTAFSNKRQAKYEADLVCCWASMCNIKYAYSKDDSWESALTKALRAIRERGIRLFNFCISEYGGAEFDYDFCEYATPHSQTYATNQAYLLGAPVFTGRADTVSHFMNVVFSPQKELHVEHWRSIPINAVEGALVRGWTSLTDRDQAVRDLLLATSGRSSTVFMFSDTLGILKGLLGRISDQQLMTHILVTAAIPIAAGTSDIRYFYAWAICPSTMPVNSLFIGREELNGTLVLAALNDVDSKIQASIIAYLTITDNQSGTFLIPADLEGKVHITFQTPQRSDMGDCEMSNDRHLRAQLRLGKDAIAGSTLSYNKIKSFLSSASNYQVVDVDSKVDSENAAISILKETIAREKGRFERRPDYLTIDIGHPQLNARGEASKKNAPRLRAWDLDDLPPSAIRSF